MVSAPGPFASNDAAVPAADVRPAAEFKLATQGPIRLLVSGP